MKHWVLRGLPLVALVLILSCPTAFASEGPSSDTCSNLRYIYVNCYSCNYEFKLGTIKMSSQYNALDDTCIDRSKVLRDCAKEFEHKGYTWKNVSAKWQYTVGGKTLKGSIDPCP